MILPSNPALIATTIIAIAGLAVMRFVLRQPTRLRIVLGLGYLSVYTYLLASAGILPIRSAPSHQWADAYPLVPGLQIFWWVVLARCLVAVGRVFLLHKHQVEERKFAIDLLAGLVYLVAGFAIVGLVFRVPVTGILATSGALALVVGLALQSSANDLFSGIALTIERPYRIADIIGLEGDIEGRVTEVTWRATHVATSSQDTIVVPNSVIAKSRIVNHSFPVRSHGMTLTVWLDGRTAPHRATLILEQALAQCRSVLRLPRPAVTVAELSATAIKYAIVFFVASYDLADSIRSEVLALIHRHTQWAGIVASNAPPDAVPLAPPDHAGSNRPLWVIEHLAAFENLSPADRETLSAMMNRRAFHAGKTVIEEGTPGCTMYLIAEGVVGLSHRGHGTVAQEVARAGPGDVVGVDAVTSGSHSAVTVATLTACTLYEFPRDAMASFLNQNPTVSAALKASFPTRTPISPIAADIAPDDRTVRSDHLILNRVTRWFEPHLRTPPGNTSE